MFDIQRFTTPPQFGLMSATDKAAIDAIPNTYVTKSRAICDVVESDANVVFLNGDGAVIFAMPIYGAKKSPQLTLSTNTLIMGRDENTITVTRLGDGALSIINEDAYYAYIDGNEIYFSLMGSPAGDEPESVQYTIAVAETAEYASATAVWTVNLTV